MLRKKIKLVATTSKSGEATKAIQLPSLLPHFNRSSSIKDTKTNFVPKIVAEWTLEEDLKCAICWGKIKPGDRTSTCPTCGRKFHFDHLRTWLQSKSFCPSCRGDWFAAGRS
ncbi:MAG: RING finger protein [Candidatus Hodarchaeales archaeon]|jgi:hypothetical protein